MDVLHLYDRSICAALFREPDWLRLGGGPRQEPLESGLRRVEPLGGHFVQDSARLHDWQSHPEHLLSVEVYALAQIHNAVLHQADPGTGACDQRD